MAKVHAIDITGMSREHFAKLFGGGSPSGPPKTDAMLKLAKDMGLTIVEHDSF